MNEERFCLGRTGNPLLFPLPCPYHAAGDTARGAFSALGFFFTYS